MPASITRTSRPATTRWRDSTDAAFRAIVLAAAAWAAAYIWRLSFIAGGVRHFVLTDDQMVSMRYAEHLAAGHGLVWNAGEPAVEGFTNFAWVLYMAIPHWLGVAKPLTSLFVQFAGALCLLATLVLVRRLARAVSGDGDAGALAAVTLTAFYVPLGNWMLQGTEVAVLTVIVALAAVRAIRVAYEQAPAAALYALLALATLVRPDMLVFGAAILAALAWTDRLRRHVHLLAGGGALLAVTGLATGLRMMYFGDPLPNTYYLKMTGFPADLRIARGAFAALLFLLQIAPLLALGAAAARRRPRPVRAGMLWWLFATQLLYSVYIGGDAWEWWGGSNRFVSMAMPLLFVAATTSVAQLPAFRGPHAATRVVAASLAGVLLLNVLARTFDPEGPIERLLLVAAPLQNDDDRAHVRAGLALKEFTEPDAVVAVTWAGSIPYFSERPAVDLLGKMDRTVARRPMHLRRDVPAWRAFYPGHLKWDYGYSIGELQPDVIQAPLWFLSLPVPGGVLDGYVQVDYGGSWLVKRDSPRIRWERLGGLPASAGG